LPLQLHITDLFLRFDQPGYMDEVLPVGNATIATATARSLALQAEELDGVCDGKGGSPVPLHEIRRAGVRVAGHRLGDGAPDDESGGGAGPGTAAAGGDETLWNG
jgi:hypothetical protein